MKMATWKYEDIDGRHGNMEKWRHGDMDMEFSTFNKKIK
jgi:hypothetical protein